MMELKKTRWGWGWREGVRPEKDQREIKVKFIS